MDTTYIAVPHHLLAPLTQQTLQAGKHALTEKPLAISLEDVDMLIALVKRQNLVLGVFYEMRYAPAHAQACELIQAGVIGNIIAVQIQTLIDKPLSYWQSGYAGRSVNRWRGIKAQAGGGAVLMNTSHLLDALTYVTGLTVKSVSAEIGTMVLGTEEQVKMLKAIQRGDIDEARELGYRLQPLADVIFALPVTDYRARTKEALKMLGILDKTTVRPPPLPIPATERETILRALQNAGLLTLMRN